MAFGALLALRVDADATTHDVHVIEHVERGLVRLDRGAPVLLTVVAGQLAAHRADPTFTTFEAATPRALAFQLWDAGYDDAGDLHVFERGEGGLSELAVDGQMVAELASEGSAAIAPEGGTAVAFAAQQSAGQSTLQLWRSETGTTSELAPSMPSSLARLAVVPYSLAGSPRGTRAWAWGSRSSARRRTASPGWAAGARCRADAAEASRPRAAEAAPSTTPRGRWAPRCCGTACSRTP